ncbi:MAG: hypothetical protein E7678_07150 [Ruminococcaceae bacterium]|nr:hypothetical protein [Oscillospiraceae bacterium]
MKEEKLHTEEISIKSSKFLSWLDNFWYHYKWHTIIISFIILVLVISIVQSCTTQKTDVVFTYAGPKEFVTAPEEKNGINSALSDVCVNEYGEKSNAYLNSFLIYSKDQIKDIESELDENGNQKYTVDTAFNTNQMNSFFEYSQSGASFILLLDPFVYQTLLDQSGNSERLVELSVLYGSIPEGANDKYSVRLGDTKIYQNVAELRVLPADTIVCLHGKLILSTTQKEYNKQVEVFKDFATLGEIQSQKTSE